MTDNKKYKVVLELNNKKYKSSAETLIEALGDIHPEYYKTKGKLTVSFGNREAKQLMYPVQMKRLFSSFKVNQTTRIIRAKYLMQSLKCKPAKTSLTL